MIIKITIIIAIIAFGLASAGDDFSRIEALYQIALENNPQVPAFESWIIASEYKAKASGWLPDPMIGIAALNLPRSSLALDETPMSGINIGITQKIPWPGELRNRSDIAEINSDIIGQNYDAFKLSLSSSIAKYYYEIKYLTAASDILNQSISAVGNMAEVIEIDYANGNRSAHDFLSARTNEERLKNRLLEFRQKQQSAILKLNLLINDTRQIDISDITSGDDTESIDIISIPDDYDANPHLKIAQLRIDKSRKESSLASSGYRPDFSLGIDYRIRKVVSGDMLRGEDFFSFKIGMTVPLWFFKNQRNKVASAKAQINAESNLRINRELQIKSRLNDLKQTIASIKIRIERYEASLIPQAEAAYKSVKGAYEVSEAGYGDYIISLLDIINIRIEKLKLINMYYHNLAGYYELTGRKFGEVS